MSKKLIYLIFFISMLGLAEGQAQDGYRLQPISGADGVFRTMVFFEPSLLTALQCTAASELEIRTTHTCISDVRKKYINKPFTWK
jgi:hypothetical protein